MGAADTFAENMRAYRKHAGLSQEALAHKAGCHRTYIGRIEQRHENISLEMAGRIARALGIDLSLFFTTRWSAEDAEEAERELEALASQEIGDVALLTLCEDGMRFEPLPNDDPDQMERILTILAEDNPKRLAEAYMEVRGRLLIGA